MKKYLWSLKEGDEMHGLFDTIDAATSDAMTALAEEGWGAVYDVVVWDARPATPADDTDFDGADEDDGGCDITQPNWWVGRWVPEDVAHTFRFDTAEPGDVGRT